jgi:hypothetical protein
MGETHSSLVGETSKRGLGAGVGCRIGPGRPLWGPPWGGAAGPLGGGEPRLEADTPWLRPSGGPGGAPAEAGAGAPLVSGTFAPGGMGRPMGLHPAGSPHPAVPLGFEVRLGALKPP